MKKGKHLTLENRVTIMTGLNQNKSFLHISMELGKDPTTISKEVKKRIVKSRTGAYGRTPNSCVMRYTCKLAGVCNQAQCNKSYCKSCKRCNDYCAEYVEEKCPDLLLPPYVCNGCKRKHECTLIKSLYNPDASQKQYVQTLTSSREGYNIREEEMRRIDEFITPLILQGQSIYHIWSNNKDTIMLDARTLYNYINGNLLGARRIDLPRAVTYKPRCKEKPMKIDKNCRIGRSEEDFKQFMELHPDTPVIEMDSVIGRVGGKVLLTFIFPETCFMLAFLRDSNTAQSVINVFNELYELLGNDSFTTLFPVCKTDNGSEFSNPNDLEFTKAGERRTQVFYCRPSVPSDKPHVEKNHVELRRILPKGSSFDHLTQEDINLVLSHVNSFSRKKLNGKSPIESFSFIYGEELCSKLGITEISPNKVILKPQLLKR